MRALVDMAQQPLAAYDRQARYHGAHALGQLYLEILTKGRCRTLK